MYSPRKCAHPITWMKLGFYLHVVDGWLLFKAIRKFSATSWRVQFTFPWNSAWYLISTPIWMFKEQLLLFLLNAAVLVEKRQMAILQSLVWFDSTVIQTHDILHSRRACSSLHHICCSTSHTFVTVIQQTISEHRIIFSRKDDCLTLRNICGTNENRYVTYVVITTRSFPHSSLFCTKKEE